MAHKVTMLSSRQASREFSRQIGCVALAAAMIAGAASADWIVTVDGERLETKGPWQIKGSRVLFHGPDGTLRSMPLDALDVAASEAANAPPPAPAAADSAPREKRASVMTLTDRDVGRAPSVAGSSEADGDGSPEDDESPLQVGDWTDLRTGEGLRIRGTLANRGVDLATVVRLTVELVGADDQAQAQTTATLTTTTLAPGASAGFYADFPGQHSYGEVRFATSGQFLTVNPPREEPASPEISPDGISPDSNEGSSP